MHHGIWTLRTLCARDCSQTVPTVCVCLMPSLYRRNNNNNRRTSIQNWTLTLVIHSHKVVLTKSILTPIEFYAISTLPQSQISPPHPLSYPHTPLLYTPPCTIRSLGQRRVWWVVRISVFLRQRLQSLCSRCRRRAHGRDEIDTCSPIALASSRAMHPRTSFFVK